MDSGIGQTGRYGQALAAFWRAEAFDPQVGLCVRGLLAGMGRIGRRRLPERPVHGGRLALILAGNTPLVGWPATLLALSQGWSVTVKRSRDERVWIDALAESLTECAPEWAARLTLIDADHAGSAALVASVDATIAYGSDTAIAALRAASAGTPFLGFGHALSIALVSGKPDGPALARDTLVFDQGGCLSPQALFVEGAVDPAPLADAFTSVAAELGLARRTDPGECRRVRETRDLALMDGCTVLGDPELRWTLIVHPEPCPLPPPTGLCILHLITLPRLDRFGDYLGPATGRLSCVGVSGAIGPTIRAAAQAAGASRVCRIGRMQSPPLDWPNGGVDLVSWLHAATDH